MAMYKAIENSRSFSVRFNDKDVLVGIVGL